MVRRHNTHRPNIPHVTACFNDHDVMCRVDYSCLPQSDHSSPSDHPTRGRSPLEAAAFKSLLYNINQLQLACSYDVVCGTTEGISNYQTRGWCVCELFVNQCRGEVIQRELCGATMAVAPSLHHALMNALAVVMVGKVAPDMDEPWQCRQCGLEERMQGRPSKYTDADGHASYVPGTHEDDAWIRRHMEVCNSSHSPSNLPPSPFQYDEWVRLDHLELVVHYITSQHQAVNNPVFLLGAPVMELCNQRRLSGVHMLRDVEMAVHATFCDGLTQR